MESKEAHVIILPYPGQGHINPMLQFGKRLASKGIKTTLATTVFISKTMHADPSSPVRIHTISDGFDSGGYSQAESTEAYLSSLQTVGSKTLAELINKLEESGSHVSAIVYDGFLPWALDVAKQFGLLGVAFLTQTCAVNILYYHVYTGVLKLPLSGSSVKVPGLPLLEPRDASSLVSSYGSYPAWCYTVFNQFRNIKDADLVLCSTFYKLEEHEVDWMANELCFLTIGPTLPSKYLDKRLEGDIDYGVNLYQPDSATCMSWLKGKPIGSVVYVSFGSMAEISEEQMEEVALGLKASSCYFLWVVRASEKSKLPENFVDEISEKGIVATWCPQLEVLANEAIGCFVTHCGLNSVIEALSLGVPIIGMPQWTDQPTNAKYVEDVWKVGVRARVGEKGIVSREEVEFCIREVLEMEKGKELKQNAMKWRNLAIEAIDKGGSSDQNIDELVAKLKIF